MRMKVVSIVIIIEIALSLFHCIEATTYIVGDGLNWVQPPSSTMYTIWASRHVFTKGDDLVFNFNTGIHNVAEVTKKAYNKCNTSSLISLHHQSPVRIPLEKKGKRYFISSLNNDCFNGQKLAINVLQHSPPPTPVKPPPEISPASYNPAQQPLPAAPYNQVVTPPPSRNSTPYFGPHVSFLSVLISLLLVLLFRVDF